jgi:hypothetical protein
MTYAIKMASDGNLYSYIPSIVKAGRVVQVCYCFINLRRCDVGFTNGRDLC